MQVNSGVQRPALVETEAADWVLIGEKGRTFCTASRDDESETEEA